MPRGILLCFSTFQARQHKTWQQGRQPNYQKCPRYCWEFHEQLWEALLEPLPKKRRPQPYWGRDNSGNGLEVSNALNYRLGGSQPYSRGKFQEKLWERFRGLSRIFPEFLPESPSRTGGMAQIMFWGGLSAIYFTGEICLADLLATCLAKFACKISGENCRQKICRQHFRQKMFGKTKPDFRQKTTQTNFTCISAILKTCHRHIPRTLPSLRSARGNSSGQATLCVHALQIERQLRGTKRGTKAGVLCSLYCHVSLVGLSLCTCIRWRLRLGPSGSRLQREHSVGLRGFLGGRGATPWMIFVGRKNQGDNPSDGHSQREM